MQYVIVYTIIVEVSTVVTTNFIILLLKQQLNFLLRSSKT